MTPADEIEPEWIDLHEIGSPFEQQLDVRASSSSPAALRYRHRLCRHTGQPEAQWNQGPQPEKAP